MQRLALAIVAVSAAVATSVIIGVGESGALDVGAVRPAGSWGTAMEVPGLGAMNKGGDARVLSVSCASTGNCAAGGYYSGSQDGYQALQGFLAVEVNGVWGKATAVPGLRALNTAGNAEVVSVSCASTGSCVAGGYYTAFTPLSQQGFVVVERNGHWGTAIQVPGLQALDTGKQAEVSSISCAAPGSCAAGGYYTIHHQRQQGFVVVERNGRWNRAIEVPGLGALNKGPYAQVSSVSCGAAGSCAAGGYYKDEQGAFVATEQHGRWSKAIPVPGLAGLNKAEAAVTSLSCASSGNCAAAGTYLPRGGYWQGFVADERNGHWRKAIRVPGLEALNKGGFAEVNSVSCASAGTCAAGGDYTDGSHHGHAFVATENNGVWGRAIEVPGLVSKGQVTSVSCASAGNCAAVGFFSGRPRHGQGFVDSEDNRAWNAAIEVPGLGSLNKGGYAQVLSVSCAPAGTCASGGYYTDRSGHIQGFIVTQAG